MLRVSTTMTGVQGAPFNSTHHFGGEDQTEAIAAADAIRAFWLALVPNFASGLSIQVNSEVEVVDEATGQTTGTFEHTTAAVPVGGSVAPLAAATQGLLRWRTATFIAGRRLQGRTFIPKPPSTFNAAPGVPSGTYQANLLTAANALLAGDTAAGGLVVYSRPTDARPGASAPVVAASAWNQWAVLRSRRD